MRNEGFHGWLRLFHDQGRALRPVQISGSSKGFGFRVWGFAEIGALGFWSLLFWVFTAYVVRVRAMAAMKKLFNADMIGKLVEHPDQLDMHELIELAWLHLGATP